jgi:uncharacterized membrane protein YgcG
MRGAGPFLKHAGRKFVRNLLWMLALFGTLGALLVFSTQLPLLEVAALVGICVSVSAALVTVVALWDGTTTPDEARLIGHNYPGPRPEGSGSGGWYGGRGDGDGGGGGGQ